MQFSKKQNLKKTVNINQTPVEQELVLQQLQYRCKSTLMNMLGNILGEAESQEVFQEALLKVYLLAKQDPTECSISTKLQKFEPLLFTIAKNLAISRVRHKQVREKYLHREELNNADKTIESLEIEVAKEQDQALLKCAIESLPPICQKVFIERKIQGKSHLEIAHQYGISKKTVENHITKGLRLCREFIQGKNRKSIENTKANNTTSKKSA